MARANVMPRARLLRLRWAVLGLSMTFLGRGVQSAVNRMSKWFHENSKTNILRLLGALLLCVSLLAVAHAVICTIQIRIASASNAGALD